MIELLHIDDNKDDHFLFTHQIKRIADDISLTWASSAADALEKIAHKKFDCLLCDYHMPKTNGLDLLRELRQRGVKTPFIFYTNEKNRQLAREAFRYGADDYFSKDIYTALFERLEHSIRSHAEKAKQLRTLYQLQREQHTFFELTLGLMVIAKFDGTIERVNAGWTELLGYTESELIGANFLDFVHKDDIEATKREANIISKGQKTHSFVNRYKHKDGNYRTFRWSSVPLLESGSIYATATDITEEQQLIKELEESREKNSRIIENSPGVFFQFKVSEDGSFSIPFISNKIFDLTLYSAKQIQDDFSLLINLLPEEKIDEFIKGIESANQLVRDNDGALSKEELKYESIFPFRRQDEYRIWHSRSAPDLQDDGSIIWEGFITDITEKYRAEERLRENELKFRTYVEKSIDIFYELDSEGNFRYVSPNCQKHFGYTAEELISLNIVDVFEPDNCSDLQFFMQNLVNDLSAREPMDLLVKHKNGSRIWISNSITPLHKVEDGSTSYLGVARNIDARKKTRLELERSEQRYKVLVEGIDEGIDIVSESEDILFMNQKGAEIFDSTPNKIVGRNLSEFTDETSWEQIRRQTGNALRGNSSRYAVDIISAKGIRKTVEVITSLMSLPGDNEKIILGAFQDVTERIQRERRLRELNKELETFTYTVSHDLKAPLRQLVGFGNLLNDHCSDQLDPEALNLLENIMGCASDASRIVDDLLQLSRAQKNDIRKSELDVSSLVNEIFNRQMIDYQDSNFSISVEEELFASADKGLLRQALENLISNAVKYSAFRDKPEISFSAATSTDSAQTFMLEDNGEGFAPEKTEKIFQPFVRLRTQAKVEGTGIGLATVKRIIERHGGKVWAESEIGKGSRFYFSLPYN
jgi:PAS domain S-box-containing protein